MYEPSVIRAYSNEVVSRSQHCAEALEVTSDDTRHHKGVIPVDVIKNFNSVKRFLQLASECVEFRVSGRRQNVSKQITCSRRDILTKTISHGLEEWTLHRICICVVLLIR